VTHPIRLLPLALLLAIGCMPMDDIEPRQRSAQPPEVRFYRAKALDSGRPLRILVLPFRHGDDTTSRSVTAAFALEMEKDQTFEVIAADSQERKVAERLNLWDGDCLDVHALTALRRRCKIDAVALGHVLRYRPYDPPVLSVRVRAISTRTGAVLWGAEAAFDARDAGVQQLMERFYDKQLAFARRGLGWQLLLSSPRHYTQFVAHELVATLRPAPTPTPVVASNAL